MMQIKKFISSVWCLVIVFSSFAQKNVTIVGDNDIAPIQFAINDIKAALSEKGFTITDNNSRIVGDIRIILANQSDTAKLSEYRYKGGYAIGHLTQQAYALRKTDDETITYWVFGGDKAGTMYGGLRLAEIIKIEGLLNFCDEQDKPYIAKRGLKFNIPLDERTPSFADNGSNADISIEYVWDIDFWKPWLDDIARYRYNFISLWNLHPFPNLVKLEDYPQAAMNDVYNSKGLVKKMSIDEKIAMWQEVIDHANNRCIDITWITWNIFLNYTKDVTELNESGYDKETINYTRQCVSELLRTYPGLKGIGTTSGERMRELETAEQKEEWVFATYGMGVLDVANEQPEREILFIHRYWWTSFENIMSHFEPVINQPNVNFDLSFKYSKARMFSAPDPIFAQNEVLPTLPDTLRSWWNLRNDDILHFRWADPDYARSYILNLPPENRTAGYHMGSDRYVWGRETILNNHTSPRQLQTQFNWLYFMLWGRMGYNPATPNSLIIKHINSKYPDVNNTSLFNAWQSASKSFPSATKFHWHDWDYMWHVETCSGYDESSGLNHTKRFYSVIDFINNPTMKGSGLMNISDYTEAIIAGNTPTEGTPFTHAGLMIKNANRALSDLANVGKSNDTETESIKKDIEAMAQAGLYYAYKIEAATYYSLFRRTKNKQYQKLAIQQMQKAFDAWEIYIEIFRSQYSPGRLSIINRHIDFDELLQSVKKDIELVGGEI